MHIAKEKSTILSKHKSLLGRVQVSVREALKTKRVKFGKISQHGGGVSTCLPGEGLSQKLGSFPKFDWFFLSFP